MFTDKKALMRNINISERIYIAPKKCYKGRIFIVNLFNNIFFSSDRWLKFTFKRHYCAR